MLDREAELWAKRAVVILLATAFALAICGYAALNGDAAHRWVAALGILVIGCYVGGEALFGWKNSWPVVLADLILGVGLIVAAAFYARGWLYLEIGLCSVLLLIHSFQLREDAVMTPPHRGLVDSIATSMLAIMATATFLRRRSDQTG